MAWDVGFSAAPVVFGKRKADSEQRVPRQLARLFKAVPKTEQHLHLSGSARKSDIRTFMSENGLSPTEADRTLKLLRPEYKDLTDYLAVYYQVPKHVWNPSQFRRAALGIAKDASRENVRILELRSSVLHKGGTPEKVVTAIEEGLREGMAWVKKHRGYDMKTAVILLAQRAGTSEDSLAHAKLAVTMAQRPDSLVRGFDLAGDEIKHSIDNHREALEYISTYGKPLGVKLTIHAGEVPVSEKISGLESLKKALSYQADRIGHGIQAILDPSIQKVLKETQIPMELCPWSNVQLHSVKSYENHPIKQFLADGLNVNLNTDSRLVCQIDLTRQLGQLWQHKLVTTWDQIKTMTMNGIRSSFIPDIDKKRIEHDALDNFRQLERRFKGTIQRYLSKSTVTEQVS